MSIAFLIKDDGGRVSDSNSVRIATNNFTLQEVELLRDIFKAKFNLYCTIQLLPQALPLMNPNLGYILPSVCRRGGIIGRRR